MPAITASIVDRLTEALTHLDQMRHTIAHLTQQAEELRDILLAARVDCEGLAEGEEAVVTCCTTAATLSLTVANLIPALDGLAVQIELAADVVGSLPVMPSVAHATLAPLVSPVVPAPPEPLASEPLQPAPLQSPGNAPETAPAPLGDPEATQAPASPVDAQSEPLTPAPRRRGRKPKTTAPNTSTAPPAQPAISPPDAVALGRQAAALLTSPEAARALLETLVEMGRRNILLTLAEGASRLLLNESP